MKVSKINFNGNFNIGLFGYATDKYCLVGYDCMQKDIDTIKSTLKVPVHQVSIAGTSVLGVFVVGNSKKLLIPQIAFPEELATLDSLGIDYAIIDTKFTALGNNILCNDNGAIVNPEMEDTAKNQIAKALDVKVENGKLENLHNVGSFGVANNLGCLITKNASSQEIEHLKNTLSISVALGTVNLGNTYIHSGVIFNNTGLLVGDISGGVEITDIDNSLSGKNDWY